MKQYEEKEKFGWISKNKFVSLSIIQNNHYYRYRNLKTPEIKKAPLRLGQRRMRY